MQPYIGAGLGMVLPDISSSGRFVSGYQFAAGLEYGLRKNLKLRLGYKYLATTENVEYNVEYLDNDNSNSAVEYSFEGELEAHSLNLGYRFLF